MIGTPVECLGVSAGNDRSVPVLGYRKNPDVLLVYRESSVG